MDGPPLTLTVHHSRLSSSRDVSADTDPTAPLLIPEQPAKPRQRSLLMLRSAKMPESATCTSIHQIGCVLGSTGSLLLINLLAAKDMSICVSLGR